MCQIGKRRLVVERGGEERARLGQEADPRFGAPLLRDVVEDVDHEVHLSRGGQQRRRADNRPVLVTARQDAIAEHALPGRAFHESAPVRQTVDRQRPAILVDDLEPLEQLRRREPEQVVARVQSAEPRSCVVGVHEPAVRSLGGNSVTHVAEDCRHLFRGRGDDLRLADWIHTGCIMPRGQEPQQTVERARAPKVKASAS